MAAPPPNDGYGQYPQQAYGQDAAYQNPVAPGYEGQATPTPPPQAIPGQPGLDHGKKKKRGYATEAFGFGSGANSAATPGPPGPGAVPQPGIAQAAAYGGYPGQEVQGGYASPAPAAAPYGAPGVAQPAVGGYQAPDPYYQPGLAQQPQGVAGITAGMGGLNVGGVPPVAQQAPQQQARVALNQLYPTDLTQQPFNVSELDLPPPPCILPPNVSCILNRLLQTPS